jgi:hydroxymethylbilane synthase
MPDGTMKIRLGTRGSRLALVQCEQVAAALRAHGAGAEIVVIRTSGDRLTQVALADFGGKALFVKEIEEALLSGQVDVGVHSLKDMPATLPAGLILAAFPAREAPADVLLTRGPGGWDGLPAGARVGTSSLRRRALVLARRPDLRPEPIRGNVETRIEKLTAGSCDATILAAAGLRRLGLEPPNLTPLPVEEFVPAVGQGILAIEAREADREVLELLGRLDDTRSRSEALAERAFLERLGADCHTPVAGHARHEGTALVLTGIVASLDGLTVLRSRATGGPLEAARLGATVAEELLAKGAKALLDASRS